MGTLTALKVKSLKEPGRYGDGRGLMLVIGRDGSRKWVLRAQHNGKRRDIGLGSANDVSLADVRDSAEDMRRALRAGRDPVAERRTATVVIPTFEAVARAVHKEHKPSWRNAKHAAQWLATLEAYVFPDFGKMAVSEIDAGTIRDSLARIWLEKPETARRVRQRIGTVLDFAYSKGWRESDAPMRAVSRGLPKQQRRTSHFSAMPWLEVPGFVANMADIINAGETTRLALEFLILTAARSGEVRGMTWSELDFDCATWTVPAERMKGGRTHRVPLSARAVQVLARRKTLGDRDSPIVFEGKPGRPLSDMTLTMPLRRANLGVTVHGFRSAFRDWCAEATATPREVAEAALAHVVANRVEAAYARSDHFDYRRNLMNAWTEFVGGGSRSSVVPFLGKGAA